LSAKNEIKHPSKVEDPNIKAQQNLSQLINRVFTIIKSYIKSYQLYDKSRQLDTKAKSDKNSNSSTSNTTAQSQTSFLQINSNQSKNDNQLQQFMQIKQLSIKN